MNDESFEDHLQRLVDEHQDETEHTEYGVQRRKTITTIGLENPIHVNVVVVCEECGATIDTVA